MGETIQTVIIGAVALVTCAAIVAALLAIRRHWNDYKEGWNDGFTCGSEFEREVQDVTG